MEEGQDWLQTVRLADRMNIQVEITNSMFTLWFCGSEEIIEPVIRKSILSVKMEIEVLNMDNYVLG